MLCLHCHRENTGLCLCVCAEMLVKTYKGLDQLTQIQFVDFRHFFLKIFVNRGSHTTVLHRKKNLYSHQNWGEIVHK